jgi:two-component system KDP operon response regulator KdpE
MQMDAKKKVLVVDDEPGILRFVSTSLTLAGYDVATTGSGAEALKLVKSQNPDIILLDIVMHPLDGFDVLQQLRAFSRLPVVVFTAQREIAEKAVNEGADGYIIKPFVPGDLVKKINSVLRS